MAADNLILEHLARLEFKIDVLYRALQLKAIGERLMPGVHRTCPYCESKVSYDIDPVANVVTTKCGCTTGKFVVNMEMFKPQNYKSTVDELERLLKEKDDE